MTITLFSGTVRLFITHGKPTDSPRSTTVSIVWSDLVFLSGTAICSNSDNFCRRTGRKIALARLIKDDKTGLLTKFDKTLLYQTICPHFFKKDISHATT